MSQSSPVSETERRKERISMAKEICSHRGENPNSVDRAGNEGWEKYEPLAGACIREAERLFALRGVAQRQQQPAGWRWRRIDESAWVYSERSPNFINPSHFVVEQLFSAVSDTSTVVNSAPATQPQTPIDIVQHVAWLQQYIIGMDETNWKDMRLRAERQLEGLSIALSISRPDRGGNNG